MRTLTDSEIDLLEQAIPALIIHASAPARLRALAAGNSVIESHGESLMLIDPDGSQTVIGRIAPRTKVQAGVVFQVPSKRKPSR